MSLFFVFNPFPPKRLKWRNFSKKVHAPKLKFARTCRVCAAIFQTRRWRQVFCSLKCKRRASSQRQILREETIRRLATEEFKLLERADPELSHYSFPGHSGSFSNSLGTHAPSTNIKVIMVDGKERVYGTLWLEKQTKALYKRNYGGKAAREDWDTRWQ